MIEVDQNMLALITCATGQLEVDDEFTSQPSSCCTCRYQRVYNPEQTFSVMEPGHAGTCAEGTGVRATVQETARGRNCVVAANAGFFNTTTGQCLGERHILVVFVLVVLSFDMCLCSHSIYVAFCLFVSLSVSVCLCATLSLPMRE